MGEIVVPFQADGLVALRQDYVVPDRFWHFLSPKILRITSLCDGYMFLS
jgi:hypothetical protein